MIRIFWIVGLGIVLVIFAFLTVVFGLGLIRDHPINLTPWFMLVVCAYVAVLALKHLLLKIREGRSSTEDKLVDSR